LENIAISSARIRGLAEARRAVVDPSFDAGFFPFEAKNPSEMALVYPGSYEGFLGRLGRAFSRHFPGLPWAASPGRATSWDGSCGRGKGRARAVGGKKKPSAMDLARGGT
jgi:hypothetical protein